MLLLFGEAFNLKVQDIWILYTIPMETFFLSSILHKMVWPSFRLSAVFPKSILQIAGMQRNDTSWKRRKKDCFI